MLRRNMHIALGTALVAAAAISAPAAHAHRFGLDVSIGGPGYAVAFGDAPYWGYPYYYRPAWRPVYVAPPVVYAPPRVVYVAPRVVYRAPYLRHRVIVREPVYYDY